MADRRAMLENLECAYAELHSYLELPVATRRDMAGIIQAFELTFELFWKAFQKLAPQEGLEATTPRQALQAGRKMGLIEANDEPHWAQMLHDRNLTSHTYIKALADEVFERIQSSYHGCFARALDAVRSALP